ncbi:Uncharacterized protein TCM_038588 [Theobroma cacao]|uniref:Uncharacterized protein n=1 Tax=Theobroma cacao TaxID=3641 RepID=A0A061GQ17_THECC|nr:Uncharacterized protein TCM_038588 [Theobroma cacao]
MALTQELSTTSISYVHLVHTKALLLDADLHEIERGLEMSAREFSWGIRSKKWSPPIGLEERIKGRGGLFVRDWAEQ